MRQELLRHSDPRLTAGTYTDTTRLETASVIEKLPDFMVEKSNDTQLGTQAAGLASHAVSSAVTKGGGNEDSRLVENKGDCHALADSVAACHSDQSETVSEFESPSLRQSDFCPIKSILSSRQSHKTTSNCM